METVCYLLQFKNQLKMGRGNTPGNEDAGTIRSDTLWGAILQKWGLLFDDDIADLCVQSPFQVSSCFPYLGRTRWYPIPMGLLDALLEKRGVFGGGIKTLTRVRYVSEHVFFKYLRSNRLPDRVYIANRLMRVSPFEDGFEAPAIFQEVTRLSVDPITYAGHPNFLFYCSDQYFARDAGLFFLARFVSPEIQDKFNGALRLLAETGLGGDRSIGKGTFTFCEVALEIPKMEAVKSYVSLSLYYPTRDEVAKGILARSWYSLIKRGGHGDSVGISRFRRKEVWMLEEGAMVPADLCPVGTSPVVLPKKEGLVPHHVHRYGIFFGIGAAAKTDP
jgi:CRISPR-associated protein Csm4